MQGYLIINLAREFYAGKDKQHGQWSHDLSKAKVFDVVHEAIGIATPLSLKAFVVEEYGDYNERLLFKNFTQGREILWGRREEGSDNINEAGVEGNTSKAKAQDATDEA
jgi:hypothetical protein